jgi:hypothetical protein
MLPEQMTTNPKQPAVQELDDMLKPAPQDLTAAKITMLEHTAIGAPPEVQQAIANYIEDLKLPASTLPVRDQWYLEQQNYVLPEQMTTNPKQPAVQELDDMLKPVQVPEDLTAAKVAMLDHAAMGAPAEVQQAVANYIEDLKLPASTMPVRDQWYLEQQNTPVTRPDEALAAKVAMLDHAAMGAPAEVQQAVANYIEDLKLPASTMPVRDQWYLDEQTPATAPAQEPSQENFLNDIRRGR